LTLTCCIRVASSAAPFKLPLVGERAGVSLVC
jgi:hypothetical protein